MASNSWLPLRQRTAAEAGPEAGGEYRGRAAQGRPPGPVRQDRLSISLCPLTTSQAQGLPQRQCAKPLEFWRPTSQPRTRFAFLHDNVLACAAQSETLWHQTKRVNHVGD